MSGSSNGTQPLPPGPQGRRLRNYYMRLFRYREFMEQLQQEYGNIVYYELPLNLRCCVVFDPDMARDVLVTQASNFLPWPLDLHEPNKLMEHGCLSVLSGEEHRGRKELMAAALAPERLDAYGRIISEHALGFRERLRPGQTVDLKSEVERYVSDAVVGAVLGREVDHKHVMRIAKLLRAGILLDYIPLGELVKKLALTPPTAELDAAIYASIRRAHDSSSKGSDLVSHLVRAADQGPSKWFYGNDRALRDEIIVYIAFTDAPTAAMCMALYHLARNRVMRSRLEQEVADVLGNRPAESADFGRLPYLHAIFKETLRLEPPPYVMPAKGAVEDAVVGGCRIPKGTLMHVGMRGIHHKSEHWEHAGEFRPERWLDGSRPDGPACPAHAYIPFGSGPHDCSGQELAAMVFVFGLASIVQRFTIEPVSPRSPKMVNVGVGLGRFRAMVKERMLVDA